MNDFFSEFSDSHSWLNVSLDVLIFISFAVISIMLAYLFSKLRKFPFHIIYVFFAAFIFTAGLTFVLGVFDAGILLTVSKLLTAVAAIITAVALPDYLPKIRAIAKLGMRLAKRLKVEKQTSEKVRESEAFLNLLLESLPSMVFVKEARSLKFIRFNRAGEILTGLDRADVIGKSDADFFSKEQAEIFNEKDRAVLENRKIADFEERIVTQNNEPKILRTRKIPILDHEGAPKYLLGISEDITEIKRVREERDQFFKASLDMLVISSSDGYFKLVNPAVKSILGYTPEEFCKIPYMNLIHPDDIQRTIDEVKSQMAGHAVLSFENRYLSKDGEYKWLSWKSTPIGNLMYACARDVTYSKEAERELRQATIKLKTLINSSPAGIIVTDNDLNVTLLNPACERMFGWTEKESIGRVIPFLQKDQIESTKKFVKNLQIEKRQAFIEVDRFKKDGSNIKVNSGLMSLYDDDGQPAGLMGVITDVTDRVRAEVELVRARELAEAATKAKSEFLANMSHEIRTPLNGVMGMTSLLLDTNLDSEQRSFGETIKSSADMLLTLVNDILDLSKAEAGKLDIEKINFDLGQVILDIERTLSFAASSKGLKIFTNVADDAPSWLKGDPTRLRQVLINLVNNAIKFTSVGQVGIHVLVDKNHNDDLELRFEISDTGIGIPQEALGRMFRAFSQADASTTRKFGGTGLGLSISKHLVTLMGGEIGVTSAKDKGSTFWFRLPFSSGVAPESEKITSEDSFEVACATSRRLRILVAEDNSVNQMIALKMFSKLGHTAIAVANGNEAIDALRTAPYDLVFMDCQMPELDGYDATKIIRNAKTFDFSQIPIIAMTANAMAGDREKCLACGMTDYISKPVKLKELMMAIARNTPLVKKSA